MSPIEQILIYRADEIKAPSIDHQDIEFKLWKPTVINLIPPGKSLKYLILALLHFTKTFKTPYYSQAELKKDGKRVCSCLIVPKFYRWPFMNDEDIQFAYVMTDNEHRGKGYSWQLIYHTYQLLSKNSSKTYWYVTDTGNPASMRLSEKMGFTLYATGKQKTFLGIKTLTAEKHKPSHEDA